MARGRAAGYDGQREAILAQAAALFAQRGWPSTSMNEVAAACGLSKATLYHYYRDKDALLVEIAEGHVSRLAAMVDAVAAEALPPQARLHRLIERILAEYAGAQHAHRVLTEDVRFLRPADRRRILDQERHVVAAFSGALAEWRPDLQAAQMTTPVAMLLFGSINWMFTWLKPQGALGYEAMAPIVWQLLCGGLPAVQAPGGPAAALPTAPGRQRRAGAAAKVPRT
ncbi:MAG: TetR/AcrR family transcriptional regulator [Aquabacterium sp.]